MLRVLRRGRRLDWIVATLSLTATAYVNQIALLFWPMLAPVGLAATRDRAALRRLATCIGVAAALFLIWVVALPRRAFFANSFFQTTSGYGFVPQLVKLATPYREMLAPWLLGVAFALGLVRLVFEAIRGREPPLAALLMWLVLPGAILLTRSMWILDYHLYAVYPPVILVAAYGVYTAARAVAILLRQPADGRLGGAILAVAVVGLCSSQWWFAPPAPSRSVFEFGSARVVSAAAAHIRQHDQGEIVIAPVGIAEAYYLERFVHSKNRPDAVARCLELVRDGPAWVFMGDNYFRKGQLDECDEYVRRHGTLILRAASAGVDDTEVSSGYALYHLAPPDRRP
jgi:hypothetical protein